MTVTAPGADTPMILARQSEGKDLYLILGRRGFSFFHWIWRQKHHAVATGTHLQTMRTIPRMKLPSKDEGWAEPWTEPGSVILLSCWINQLQSPPTSGSLLHEVVYFLFLKKWSCMLLVAESILIDSASQNIPSHLNSRPVDPNARQPFPRAVP